MKHHSWSTCRAFWAQLLKIPNKGASTHTEALKVPLTRGVCECVAEDKTCNPGAVPGVFCKLLSQEPTQCSTEQVDPLQVQMIQQVLEPPAPFLQGVVWGPLHS